MLAHVGATVTVEGLPGDRISALLTEAGIAFSELRRHRASLEEAYMDLARGSIEYAPEAIEGSAR